MRVFVTNQFTDMGSSYYIIESDTDSKDVDIFLLDEAVYFFGNASRDLINSWLSCENWIEVDG